MKKKSIDMPLCRLLGPERERERERNYRPSVVGTVASSVRTERAISKWFIDELGALERAAGMYLDERTNKRNRETP